MPWTRQRSPSSCRTRGPAATHAGPPLDRISVRDYTRQVEIGAFRSERGVTQRIRFNVVLEVSHHAAAQDDDVDKVISYDTITEAIEHELGAERMNLLETLAERVAAAASPTRGRCGPSSASRSSTASPARSGSRSCAAAARGRAPGCARWTRAGGGAAAARGLSRGRRRPPTPRRWRDALARWGHPLVVCVGPAAPQPPAASEAQRRIGLLAIEQAAWAFADGDPRFGVAASRTELDWALKAGRLSVWAPAHMAAAAVGRPAPDASDPVALAAWLAGELGAEMLVVAGTAAGARRPPCSAPPTRGSRRPGIGGPDDRRIAADRQLRLARPRLPARRHQGQGLDARQLRGPKGLVLMFICNHCPYVQAVIDKLARRARRCTTSASAWRRSARTMPRPSRGQLREDGRLRAPAPPSFPYLHDVTQSVARAYGAPARPTSSASTPS